MVNASMEKPAAPDVGKPAAPDVEEGAAPDVEEGAAPDVEERAAPDVTIELVVAVAENDVIGRGNRLPWRLSSDLRRFKALTVGRFILMGRRTHDSIGRALPGRTNLVMTRTPGFASADCLIVDTLDAALAAVPLGSSLMVIGGADVYRQCLPLASRIHLTLVHTRIEDGDTFFAEWRGAQWHETRRERHAADGNNEFGYSFVTLDRVRGVSTGAPED